jgi:hypothetical protein
MWRSFVGTIAGNGLAPAAVQGEFEETTGTPVPPHRGRFLWHGAHVFQPGEVYRLEIEPPRFYEVRITGVLAGPWIEFLTT